MTIGSGTLFQRSADGGTTYTQVAGVTSLSFPSMTKATNDTSRLDTTDLYKEFTSGQIDPGEMEVTFIWDNTNTGQDDLYSDFESTTTGFYQITFPNAATFTYQAVVTGWGKTVEKDNDILTPISFKLSGRPVRA